MEEEPEAAKEEPKAAEPKKPKVVKKTPEPEPEEPTKPEPKKKAVPAKTEEAPLSQEDIAPTGQDENSEYRGS